MSEHSYRLVEIVGSSTTGVDDAIRNGIASVAGEGHLDWFEVVEIRGHLVDQHIAHTQVTMKVGYRAQ